MSDPTKPGDERLIQSILARTSGSPCASARGRIVAFADGELEAIDADLMRLHVGGCPACAALAGALRRLSAELPCLAEVEPDPQFVRDVLARMRPRPSLAARARARLEQIPVALARRPRIAWEVAYIGTCVLALARLAPVAPVDGVGHKARELVRPVVRIQEDASRTISSAWEATASEAESRWSAVRGDLGAAGSEMVGSLGRAFGTLWRRAASEGEESQDSGGD